MTINDNGGGGEVNNRTKIDDVIYGRPPNCCLVLSFNFEMMTNDDNGRRGGGVVIDGYQIVV